MGSSARSDTRGQRQVREGGRSRGDPAQQQACRARHLAAARLHHVGDARLLCARRRRCRRSRRRRRPGRLRSPGAGCGGADRGRVCQQRARLTCSLTAEQSSMEAPRPCRGAAALADAAVLVPPLAQLPGHPLGPQARSAKPVSVSSAGPILTCCWVQLCRCAGRPVCCSVHLRACAVSTRGAGGASHRNTHTPPVTGTRPSLAVSAQSDALLWAPAPKAPEPEGRAWHATSSSGTGGGPCPGCPSSVTLHGHTEGVAAAAALMQPVHQGPLTTLCPSLARQELKSRPSPCSC